MLEFLVILLAYLLGSIPSGVWIGKFLYRRDVRDYGSHNSGTTNTFRTLGKKAGTIVMIMDILKGTIAALLPTWFGLPNPPFDPMIVGLIAVLGHCYPIFANFKGGKAVATTAGIALATEPLFLIVIVAIWGVSLYFTSMVSFASITAVSIAAFASFFFVNDILFTIVVWVAFLVILYRHRENIQRIKNGTENRVSFGLGLL